MDMQNAFHFVHGICMYTLVYIYTIVSNINLQLRIKISLTILY